MKSASSRMLLLFHITDAVRLSDAEYREANNEQTYRTGLQVMQA